jgi:hypothetical protein
MFVLNLNGSPYAGQYYTGRFQFAFMGDNLTAAEVKTIDGLINIYQTRLSRNTYNNTVYTITSLGSGTTISNACSSPNLQTYYSNVAIGFWTTGTTIYMDSNLTIPASNMILSNSGGFPGDYVFITDGCGNITLKADCPAPTPTATRTPTPTRTPTRTPTPTNTPTPTTPSLDPDATTYINAVISSGGTLTTPQRAAINTFFVGLKTDGIYNKFYYLHLFFGGTAGSNAINAKTPGTYNLSFQGTWTHSVTGSTTIQNNANYAESGFIVSSSSPSTTETNFSFGYMMSDKNNPITAYQYQGIGTSTSDYMIIGQDWVQEDGITNFWSTLGGNNLLDARTKTGVWNSVSRSGSTAWYVAGLFNGTSISSGLTKSSLQTTTFTPSSTPYDINLFRVNGLNLYTIGGNALLNYASTYLSPTEIDNFAQRVNTLQVAFARNIFT